MATTSEDNSGNRSNANALPFEKLFHDLTPPPASIRDWSMAKVDAVHRFLCIERWNNHGDIGMRAGTNYGSVAERLLIHVDSLKAADEYVHYTRLKELSDRIKVALSKRTEIKPDYYSPIEETAYCGTYTLNVTFVLDGCSRDPALADEARQLAKTLSEQLPPEVDGFKVTNSVYTCTSLGTTGTIGLAFLWRRGAKVREMKPSTGMYGMQRPEEASHWHQDEWNDGKPLKQVSIPAR